MTYYPSVNEFRGNKTLQIVIQGIISVGKERPVEKVKRQRMILYLVLIGDWLCWFAILTRFWHFSDR